MARKRKKSKKRKVVAKEAVERDANPDAKSTPATAPDSTDIPDAPDAPDAKIADAVPEGAETEALAVEESAPTAVDEPLEIIDISIDDDLDDTDLRAQLIADAAGLVNAATGDQSEDEPEYAPLDADHPSSGSEPADAEPSAAAGTGAVARSTSRRAATPPPPRLSRDALVALSEMHAEGIATIAGERVLDLGEGSSSEDRDRLLAAALAQVEMQDAIYRVPTASRSVGRWKAVVALLILMIAGLAAINPPGFVEPDPPPVLRAADRLYGIRIALLLEVQQIEAFRSREQRLPDSLDEVATSLLDVRYVKSSNRLFQLVAYGPDGRALVYDSASPEPEFEVVRRTWVTTRDAR